MLVTVTVKCTVPPGTAGDGLAVAAMTSGPDPMTSVTASVAVAAKASLTWTVKAKLPAVAGVPDRTPVEAFSVRPDGRLPADTDQANGPVPPVTVRVSL